MLMLLPATPMLLLLPDTCPLLQGRLTLLLGPPGCGKSTFLQNLCGRASTKGMTVGGPVLKRKRGCTVHVAVAYSG